MPRRAQLGSISSGTMRPEDLIPVFLEALRTVRGSVPKDLYNLGRAFQTGKLDAIHTDELRAELENALSEFAPPYAYFGAHDGNDSDYGFWLCADFQRCAQENGALEVSDTSEVPDDYSGEVLHINDHGNATLYYAHKGKLTEIWSVV